MSALEALPTAAVAPAASIALRLRGVTKAFDGTPAVRGVDLEVERGSLVALLGPSGCGKTTALRCIAGLETIDGGTIEVDGRLVAEHGAPRGRRRATRGTHVAAQKRRIGMVFQDYALFPHLTVLDNVLYGLRSVGGRNTIGSGRTVQRDAALDALRLVDLLDHADKMPDELSGGQQQRVALARALAPRPDVILLDEPFSNLDAALRQSVRDEVRAILKEAGTTAIFVTHDQEEALSMADQVAVMADGVIHQVAEPHELYTRPATAFVARFVGDADVLPGRVNGAHVETSLGRVETVTPVGSSHADVVMRPETLHLRPDAAGSAVVEDVTFFGHDQLIRVRLADGTVVRSRSGPEQVLHAGDRVRTDVTVPLVAFAVDAATGPLLQAVPTV